MITAAFVIAALALAAYLIADGYRERNARALAYHRDGAKHARRDTPTAITTVPDARTA